MTFGIDWLISVHQIVVSAKLLNQVDKTAVNISRRIARSSAFFETVYACVNKVGVDTLVVRNFYAT